MATLSLPRADTIAERKITQEEAAELLSREERFMATVQAMNALLIAKGVYSAEEFEALYVQWAMNQQRKPKSQRPGWRSRIISILTFGA